MDCFYSNKSILYRFIPILLFFGISTAAFSQKLPPQFEDAYNKTAYLFEEGKITESLDKLSELQTTLKEQNFHAEATKLYQDIFGMVCILDLPLEEKHAQILTYKDKESTTLYQGIYYGALAHMYIFHGQEDSMQYYFDLAINIFQQEKQPLYEFDLILYIGMEFYFLNQMKKAKPFFYLAKKIYQTYPDKEKLSVIEYLDFQTLVFIETGEYRTALKSALQKVELVEKKSEISTLEIAHEYGNLGTIYSTLKDHDNAIKYYKKGLNLCDTDEYPDDVKTFFISNLASTYKDIDDYKTARELYQKTINYLKYHENPNKDLIEDFINSHMDLAYCSALEDQWKTSLFHLKEVEKIQAQHDYYYRKSILYSTYGLLYFRMKDYDKAKAYYLKSIEAANESIGLVNSETPHRYLDLGDIAAIENDYNLAIKYYQKALEVSSVDFSDIDGVSNPIKENVRSYNFLTRIAKEKATTLLKRFQKEQTTSDLLASYETILLAIDGLEYISKTIKNVESKQRWLHRSLIQTFEKAIEIAVTVYHETDEQQYLNAAFRMAERSKSMLMMEAFQENDAMITGGIPEELADKIGNLEDALVFEEKQLFDARIAKDDVIQKEAQEAIFEIRHELDAIKSKIEDQYPEYFALKYATNTASLSDIQAQLDNNTMLLEYFEGKQQVYIFSITNQSITVHQFQQDKAYQNHLQKLLRGLVSINPFRDKPVRAYNNFVEHASALYKKLLKEQINSDHPHLIIIPDGTLGYLPFEVLLDQPVDLLSQGDHSTNFSTLPYILRNYTINYNYSATLLLRQLGQTRMATNHNIFALAPSYEESIAPEWREKQAVLLRDKLGELPGAIEEVNALKEKFSGKFLVGTAANETLFKEEASTYGILHLAMHGLVNHKQPNFSGLALTEDHSKTEDNFLYAYEIKELDLHADLVVLSACETGSGKYQRGEGVVSIGRSFMYAGTPALLMTLWKLNDQTGSFIIAEFYKNIQAGMTKDEAIRQAKLIYLNQASMSSAHPFLWAPFIQVGDFSPISINSRSSNLWIYATVGSILLLLSLLYLKIKKEPS